MSEPAKKPGHAPESYDPKDVPEIVRMAAQGQGKSEERVAVQPAVKPAPATIKAKVRCAVRIIELPACKMVWSGLRPNEADETIQRFEAWWNAQDELRRDRFYVRDFLWWNEEAKGIAWGLAVTDVPADTGGFEVIDFPGGLYAVATYAGDLVKHDAEEGALGAWRTIKAWVMKSGCFALDVGAERHTMWHCFNPRGAYEAMGYGQCDQYVPIRMKEEAK